MMLVRDQDFHAVEAAFHEAFFTHTSTSPNLQILASLDCARRQMELEGYELTAKATELAFEIRRSVNEHPLISKYFEILTAAQMIPAQYRGAAAAALDARQVTWHEVLDALDEDEIALDPTRLTLFCGRSGLDGTQLKNILAERFDIQLNKTSRNSVLLQVNINNTRSDAAHLIKALADLAREFDDAQRQFTPQEQAQSAARVKSLIEDVPELPNFSHFHESVRDKPGSRSPEGDMRAAFYASYRADNCEYVKLASREIEGAWRTGQSSSLPTS